MTIMWENVHFMSLTKSKCGHKTKTSAWFSLPMIKYLLHSSNIWLFIIKIFFKKKPWQAGCRWNEVSVFSPEHLLPSCGRETLLLADWIIEYSQQCLGSVGSRCESLWKCKCFTQMNAIHLISEEDKVPARLHGWQMQVHIQCDLFAAELLGGGWVGWRNTE